MRIVGMAILLQAIVAQTDNRITAADGIDFGRQILPILARRCFPCHGPEKAESGLRLNTLNSATAKLESGVQAIVAGQPDASELIRRVTATDPDLRMPPGDKPLNEAEIDLLRGWIEAGASWKTHWAFEPLGDPKPPAVTHSDWVRNPIDAFVLQRLEARGVPPSSAANPRQLIRRVYHDLTGLPPPAEEIERFLAAAEVDLDKAYEQIVDSLLDSPRYGERWARHWLDVVRYADTNSFERDGPKPYSWRYRDYVIRSLNADKRYDLFLREQLAGDELPEATADGIIATGFYRLGLWDDEPVDRELAMYDGLDDILTTVGQGLLGLTLNCARCHDHKIDPIPQREYYSLLAFFRNLTPNGNENPQVVRPIFAEDGDKQLYEKSQAELNQKRNDIQGKLTAVEMEFRGKWTALEHQIEFQDLDDLEYRFYRDSWDRLPDFDQLKPETVARADRPLFDIRYATRPDHFGFVFTGILKVPADGEYTFRIDSDDGSRLTLNGKPVLEYDGVHGLGKPKSAKVQLASGRVPIRLDYFQAGSGQGLTVTWSGPGVENRSMSAITAEGIDLADIGAGKGDNSRNIQELLRQKGESLIGKTRMQEYRAWQKELEELKRKKPWNQYALCVTELGPVAADTFVLGRGNPQSRGEKVEPAFLTSAGGGAAGPIESLPESNSTGRRSALASWITQPSNRLTTRVIVNRIWQHHFGRGIVRTPNNFGQLGEPPTHPELLDWLAQEFMRGDWRFKALHKSIVMSNTYRQSSAGSEKGMTLDPANDLFWRQNPRRLGAEEVRDTVLAAGGRLNTKMFGPGVYIDLSAEVLAGQSQPGNGWGKSSPEDQARRSIYIHVKRSLIPPILANFDFPDTDTTCESRFITTQPAQALTLLNGDWINQQASLLATRVRSEAGESLDRQLAAAIRWCLGRSATEVELTRGRQLVEQLGSRGGLASDATLAGFCLMLFNLNEFLYVD